MLNLIVLIVDVAAAPVWSSATVPERRVDRSVPRGMPNSPQAAQPPDHRRGTDGVTAGSGTDCVKASIGTAGTTRRLSESG